MTTLQQIQALDAQLKNHAGNARDLAALDAQLALLDQMISLCPQVTGANARYAQKELLPALKARHEQLAKRVQRLTVGVPAR